MAVVAAVCDHSLDDMLLYLELNYAYNLNIKLRHLSALLYPC